MSAAAEAAQMLSAPCSRCQDLISRERGRQMALNNAYERGWDEGWQAAVTRVRGIGLDKLLATEHRLEIQAPLLGEEAVTVFQFRDRVAREVEQHPDDYVFADFAEPLELVDAVLMAALFGLGNAADRTQPRQDPETEGGRDAS